MKTARKFVLPAIAVSFALVFAIVTPFVMAESGYGMHSYHDGAKSHKGHWAIQVEGVQGSLQITENVDKAELKAKVIPLSQAADGVDAQKASLGIAVNENGEKYLVWKLVSINKDLETETASATIYIVDAGNGEKLGEITKEFDSSMKYTRDGDHKWSHYKMEGHLADLTPEEREAKFAQYKEMKQAFESLSDEDQATIKSHFHGMKEQFADLTEEEKQAKHAEYKQQMEGFMELSLEEKISYLKYLAISLRNQA